MHQHILYLLVFLFIFPYTLRAQFYKVKGKVLEQATGLGVQGASIKEKKSKQQVHSNQQGEFEFKVSGQRLNIRVSMVSFREQEHSFLIQNDTTLIFSLEPYALDEVEITGYKDHSQVGLNKLSLSVEQFEKMPVLFGEVDPLRSIALFPGIQLAIEGSSSFVVRGGLPGQNKILLDGINLYNPYHLLSIFSAFNSYAISSLDIYKGMFPARYGNRIAAVLDAGTFPKESVSKKNRNISIGLLSSKIGLRDSLPFLHGDYLLAGRVSYLSLFTLPSLISYRGGGKENHFDYWLYDLNGNLRITDEKFGSFQLSTFAAKDRINSREGIFKEQEERTKIGWGNAGISFRHALTTQRNWKLQSTLSLSAYTYGYTTSELRTIADTLVEETSESSYTLRDIGIKTSIGKEFDTGWGFQLGLSAKQFQTSSMEEFTPRERQTSYLLNPWLEMNLKLNQLSIRPGLRTTFFMNEGTDFFYPEARINLEYELEGKIFSASFGQVSQALHLISGSGLGLPNDIWLPASRRFPIQTGFQYTVGIKLGDIEKGNRLLQIEAYVRKVKGLVLYRPEFFDIEQIPDINQVDRLFSGGSGKAFGIEILYKYKMSSWNGWLSYTLANSIQHFADFRGGLSFPSPYDQRHNLQFVANKKLSQRWTFSTTFQFQSGRPVFLPESQYINLDGNEVFVYPDTPSRFPAYHRLDIGFSYKKRSKQRYPPEWKFGIYNLYNRRNPLFLQIDQGSSIYAGGQLLSREPTKLKGFSIFPFTPYLSYGWKF